MACADGVVRGDDDASWGEDAPDDENDDRDGERDGWECNKASSKGRRDVADRTRTTREAGDVNSTLDDVEVGLECREAVTDTHGGAAEVGVVRP